MRLLRATLYQVLRIGRTFRPPLNLLDVAHRVFVKEGRLEKVGKRGNLQPYMFWLFNDVIIYGAETGAVLSPLGLGGGGAKAPAYKHHRTIHYRGANVERPGPKRAISGGGRWGGRAFKLEGKEKSFTLLAASAAEREAWVRAIAEQRQASRARRMTYRTKFKSDEEHETEQRFRRATHRLVMMNKLGRLKTHSTH